MQSGKRIKQNTFRNEVKLSEWAFDGIKEAFEKVAKDEARKEHRPRNNDKKHRLPATHHRASGEARRRYDVTHVPAL